MIIYIKILNFPIGGGLQGSWLLLIRENPVCTASAQWSTIPYSTHALIETHEFPFVQHYEPQSSVYNEVSKQGSRRPWQYLTIKNIWEIMTRNKIDTKSDKEINNDYLTDIMFIYPQTLYPSSRMFCIESCRPEDMDFQLTELLRSHHLISVNSNSCDMTPDGAWMRF